MDLDVQAADDSSQRSEVAISSRTAAAQSEKDVGAEAARGELEEQRAGAALGGHGAQV